MYPVTLVSLGPGDPELITLKGLRTLQEADCIFCPETGTRQGAPACSRAAHILAQLHIPDNKIERFHLPMSKDRQQAMASYDQAFLQIRTLCADNRRICIVAEGDAGLYASIHYIYDRLRSEGYPVEQIPGIPAFIASGRTRRAAPRQPATTAHRHSRPGHHRRHRAVARRRRHRGHHEAVTMHRRNTPLHQAAPRIHLPVFRKRGDGTGTPAHRPANTRQPALPLLLSDDYHG